MITLILASIAAQEAPQRQVDDAARATGWYIVEYVASPGDVVRAGPFDTRATCLTRRRDDFPTGPRSHPELDVMTCVERRSLAASRAIAQRF